MNLIAPEAMTIADIIAKTGDKATSVTGTLQGLKKNGLAAPDENKLWRLVPQGIGLEGGNSEASIGSEY
jgi:DNA-binding IclR family transcriptional regulator